MGSKIKNILLKSIFRNNNSGTSIFDENWDNLIILDACRYDIFCQILNEFKIEGKLEYRISKGSDTTEFLLKNFTEEKYDDIVYITANPFVNMILKNKVYRIIPLWKFGWSERYGTVHPKTMYYYALRTYVKYPGKRFIIHFIQPHHPYIGYSNEDTGQRLLELIKKEAEENISRNFALQINAKNILRVLIKRKLYYGYIYDKLPKDLHLRMYTENLRFAMYYVTKLSKLFDGKVVITSDHGEAFGEKIHPLIPIRVYGHLPEIRIPALIKVPWFIVDDEYKVPKEEKRTVLKNELTKLEVHEIKSKIQRIKQKLKTK